MEIKNYWIRILLLFVILIFSVLNYNDIITLEGYDSLPVPKCDSNDNNDSNECNNSDYILKTQVIPPVCPSFHSFLGHEKYSDNSKDKKKK